MLSHRQAQSRSGLSLAAMKFRYITCTLSCGLTSTTVYYGDLVAKHQVNFHSFADDSQIYLHCRISEASSAVSKLEDCISVIGHCSRLIV